MAARGAGAAGQATDHWVPGLWHGCNTEPMDRRLLQRLRELGWSEGRDGAIEYRWAGGRDGRAAEVPAEIVRVKGDWILPCEARPILAATQATTIIPIVFALPGDPVATGLVASLARPGGNLTGLSNQLRDTATKRLELLREVVPNLRRLAIIANVDNPAGVLT